jgi:hypothetical protein
MAKTTTVRMPERCSRSASSHTPKAPQNWTTAAIATSWIRAVSGTTRRDSASPSTTLPIVTTRSNGITPAGDSAPASVAPTASR